jgi:hypothetical protein
MTMAETQTKRHPIRGALYGLLLGLAVWYFLQFEFATFGFDTATGVITRAVIVVIAGIVLGVAWAYVAPARKPKEAAPAAAPVPYTAPAPPEVATTASTGGAEAAPLPDDDE